MSDPIRQPPRTVGAAVTTSGPIQVGHVTAEAPVRTGWTVTTAASSLDDLPDVDGVASAPSDTVLVKDPDGVLRPRSYAPMRGHAVTMTATGPAPASEGVEQAGDIHFTTSPDGIVVYQLEEN